MVVSDAALLLVRETLGEQIAATLRHDIVSGRIKAGDTLLQDSLCERFATSRMPVRDALHELVHEGFLEWTRKNQARVVEFTNDDIADMFEMQGHLSGRLVRRATERASGEEIERLCALYSSAMEHANDMPSDELNLRNREFHRTIDALAKAPKLVAALRAVTIDVHRDFLYRTKQYTQTAGCEHLALLAAIRHRNSGEAERIMSAHVANARRTVLEGLADRSTRAQTRH
jgi:DNA-binding GntR family transcriptional regulator